MTASRRARITTAIMTMLDACAERITVAIERAAASARKMDGHDSAPGPTAPPTPLEKLETPPPPHPPRHRGRDGAPPSSYTVPVPSRRVPSNSGAAANERCENLARAWLLAGLIWRDRGAGRGVGAGVAGSWRLGACGRPGVVAGICGNRRRGVRRLARALG